VLSAEEFARQGCKVYATARKVEKMSGLSSFIEQLELDVLSDVSVKKAVEAIIEREGRIDILVNNAGMGATSEFLFNDSLTIDTVCSPCMAVPILDIDLELFKRAVDTNLFAIVRLTQAVVPHMAKRKSGLVINIGSISGGLMYVYL
jgi:1-acylglycerone phosphate reductase